MATGGMIRALPTNSKAELKLKRRPGTVVYETYYKNSFHFSDLLPAAKNVYGPSWNCSQTVSYISRPIFAGLFQSLFTFFISVNIGLTVQQMSCWLYFYTLSIVV